MQVYMKTIEELRMLNGSELTREVGFSRKLCLPLNGPRSILGDVSLLHSAILVTDII